MAKDKITEYDATAANNTVVGDVNLAENSALPSDMNNAVREVMSHQKEAFGSGTPMFVDQTNNRVGVNTTAVAADLEVGASASKINALTVKTATGSGGVAGISFMAGQTTAGREKAAMFFKETNGGAHYTGDLVFAIATSSGSAAQVAASDEVCRITSNGLTFNGDTAATNALDDYEEGTFTPTIDGEGSCSIGTSSVLGLYTKVGRLVNCQISYSVNSVSGGASNLAVDIGGLPFTTNSSSNFAATIRSQNLAAACEGVQVIYFNNSTGGRIEEFNGQGGTNFSDHVASNSVFIINVTYMT